MQIYKNDDLYQAIIELNIVDKQILDDLFQTCKEKRIPLGGLLLDRDHISDENLGKIIADLLNLPFISLSQIHIDKNILKLVPKEVAEKHQIIPFKLDDKTLHLVMADPNDIVQLDFLRKKLNGIQIKIYFSTKRDISNTLSVYLEDVDKIFKQIISEYALAVKKSDNIDPPIIKIVNTIINYAYQSRASDIHIEPTEHNSQVRFRIDGIMKDVVDFNIDLHEQIVTRIKVIAKLQIDEHFAAQDGKIHIDLKDERLDIRVSVMPITRGEKIVMRLLSEKARRFTLQTLGFSESDLEKTSNALQKPHGMILATGPTGCGKTTTLYSILKILNKRDVNITSIEDPVEYDIEGCNQIQVNLKTDLTFAKGLRSVVRQDPDIIFVGEIRDTETADIAVNSAMTGHLLLSTMHTNDASTSIPRLIDMEIEPFLIASSINLIIAQRLVRQICPKCKVSKMVEVDKISSYSKLPKELIEKHFGNKKTIRIYEGKGCPVCHQTGYQNRIGIFEVLVIDDKIRELIVGKKNASVIKKAAMEASMTTILDDGLRKAMQSITTIDEVLRVAQE